MSESESPESMPSWNLSEYKINTIGQLLQRATTKSVLRQHSDSFECWRQVALVLDNRLTDKEREELDKLELDALTKGRRFISRKENLNITPEERIVEKPVFEYYVKIYARKINQLLREKGLDIKERDLGAEEID